MRTLARQNDADDIVRRLRGVRPDSRRRFGRMTPHQMVCHLADNFRMALGERAVASRSGLVQRTIVKWAALYAPIPWPTGIPTTHETDQERGGTRPVEFAADLAHAVALLERLLSRAESLERRVHPVFGRMSVSDWLRWAYLHSDHHLRQFGC